MQLTVQEAMRRLEVAMRYLVRVSVIVLAVVGAASADTYVVNPDGTGDFPTIQAAIDAAVDGDIIELTDGTFTGDGNRDIDYLGKAITVRSQSGNPDACVIDCQGAPEEPHRGIYFHSGEGSGSILSGLTIQNGCLGQDDCGAGVACEEDSSPRIVSCVFCANSAQYGGAIECLSASPAVSDCAFLQNTAECGGAIICCYESSLSLSNCSFVNNTAYQGGAVYT